MSSTAENSSEFSTQTVLQLLAHPDSAEAGQHCPARADMKNEQTGSVYPEHKERIY